VVVGTAEEDKELAFGAGGCSLFIDDRDHTGMRGRDRDAFFVCKLKRILNSPSFQLNASMSRPFRTPVGKLMVIGEEKSYRSPLIWRALISTDGLPCLTSSNKLIKIISFHF
jgi:hypothetical protein